MLLGGPKRFTTDVKASTWLTDCGPREACLHDYPARGPRCLSRARGDRNFGGSTSVPPMVAGLAFLATAVATMFWQNLTIRWSQTKSAYHGAWAVSLAMFALGSAMLAVGTSTSWDRGIFRAYFLFGAILNVPWLAMGTLHLIASPKVARRVQNGLLVFSGVAAGVLMSAPMVDVLPNQVIPVGKEVFTAPLPRILAAIASSVGALVVFGGAAWSAFKLIRSDDRNAVIRSRVTVNVCIALGTLILALGGVGNGHRPEWFAFSLAAGIGVMFAGFRYAERSSAQAKIRSANLAAEPTGN